MPAFRLFLGNFQPFAPPDSVAPLLVHMPAISPEQGGNAAIAIATGLFSESDDRFGQRLLALPAARLFALGRPVLTERLVGPAFGDAKPFDDPVNTRPAARRVQKFPLAASARISLSSVRSETAFQRRRFSFSNSLRRRA